MKDRALIIFVKAPISGKVKTRLARELGEEAACRLYRDMARDIAEKLGRDDSWDAIIAYTPREEEVLVRDWLGTGFLYRPQQGDDLGERMFLAIADALASGYCKAVLTGSDIPDLSPEIVRQAFEVLDNADVVLGPARDGGYYLIGMKNPVRGLFREIDWSTSGVFDGTVEIIRAAELSLYALERLSDVDSAEDLNVYFEQRGEGKNKPSI